MALHDRAPSATRVFRVMHAPGWLVALLVLMMVTALPLTALAFGVPDPPVAPPPGGGPAGSLWQSVVIPDLPAGASLGEMWVSGGGQIYVWAIVAPVGATPPLGMSARPETPVPPGDPGTPPVALATSILYHWNGMSWVRELTRTGELARDLYGTSPADVYASTIGVGGVVRMFHYEGTSLSGLAVVPDPGGGGGGPPEFAWREEPLGNAALTASGRISGVGNDVFFRAGAYMLQHGAAGWATLGNDEDMASGHELVVINPHEMYAICPTGHCEWLADTEAHHDYPHGEVLGAWGVRDFQDQLHMFVTGHDGRLGGLQVWRFEEHLMPTGYQPVLIEPADPVTGGGEGTAIWGSGFANLFVVGRTGTQGRVYHFDGVAWTRLHPDLAMAAAVDVHGIPGGDLWISTTDGRLVRFMANQAFPDRAPDVSYASPMPPELSVSPTALPVSITNVLDPEGEPVHVAITGVTMDEHAVPGEHCPAAVLQPDGTALLNAPYEFDGNGRVYTLAFTATDPAGMSRDGKVTICVPGKSYFCQQDELVVDALDCRSGPWPPTTADLQVVPAAGALRALELSIPEAATVHVAVYDVAGRRLATLASGAEAAGTHRLTWNTTGLPSGMYFCRMRAGNTSVVRSLLVTR